LLVQNGTITERAKRTLKTEIKRFDLHDELLFGCVLDPGEYLHPLPITKNSPHRARDRWQGTIGQLPPVHSTMMKTSSYSFPFRIEFISRPPAKELNEIIKLIYHTALLLPNYAFPVGIDIADKYAKIPDWLSSGVSAQLAASIFKRCIQAGDVRLLQQMRTLLGRSPRDFFYRPTA
ncbi:MAG TPA: DNA double-strand break repair nuclease NurA, partial [Terriglobia bacterium]|nr:DNA double-strand break repair nuclease NurA [Terriglobia bacterium]